MPQVRPSRASARIHANRAPGQLAGKCEEDLSMSATIRLKRFGTKKRPYYRIVVMDKHNARDGKTIDELGYFHPIDVEEKQISFDEEKAKAWIAKGAEVSDTVRGIFNKKGITITRKQAE
jgi:small subunit ribosomal protein S16